MNILTISGSVRKDSSNVRLLEGLPAICPHHSFTRYDLAKIPTFLPDAYDFALDEKTLKWKKAVKESDALIVCTPEYIHNIPAILKNALEWFAKFGELADKPVLAMTYTPQPPRGEKAMQSLLWSLLALDANVVTSLTLWHEDISFDNQGKPIGQEGLELLKEALGLL